MRVFQMIFAIILINLAGFKEIGVNSESKICTKSVIYSVTVTKAQPYRKQVTARRWNGVKYTKYINDTRIVSQIEWKTKSVEVCCDGYTRYRSKCVPLCDEICENSKCTAPNTCTCNEGYKHFNTFRCVPHCDNCKFGSCIAPNYCECFSSYEKDSNGTCQPKCVNACINGYCANPDFCMCYEGYKLSTNAIHICDPICEPQCTNGICTGPNICQCNEGYEKDPDNMNSCIPKCQNDCGLFGKCIKPDICQCDDEFERQTETMGCELLTTTTPTSITTTSTMLKDDLYDRIKPDIDTTTELEESTFYDDDTMETTTEDMYDESSNCLNGFYIDESNICECFDGYILDYNQTNLNICVPLCDNEEDGCINGTCIAPYTCKCFKGFELSATNKFFCYETQKSGQYIEISKSYLNWWTLWFCIGIILVIVITLILFLYVKLYHLGNYDIDKRESNSSVVQYSK